MSRLYTFLLSFLLLLAAGVGATVTTTVGMVALSTEAQATSPPTLLSELPPGTYLRNVYIPDSSNPGQFHEHPVDFYIPSGTIATSVVWLHGGSGNYRNFAYNLGVSSTPLVTVNTVNWPLLAAWHSIFIFPNGQACTGTTNAWNPNGVNTISSQNPNGVQTWSNRVMWSQANDLQLMVDLSAYITTTYGAIGKNIGGHSNGGMMAQMVWREAPANYSHYISISGPASNYYIGKGYIPTFKPMLSIHGAQDTVVDNMDGPAGAANTTLTGGPYTGGTTTVHVADATNLANGNWILLTANNSANSTWMTQITGLSGTTLTISPATPAGFTFATGSSVHTEHFFDATLEQNRDHYSVADQTYDPTTYPYFFPTFWIGPWVYFQAQITAASLTPPSIGSVTTTSYVSAGGHGWAYDWKTTDGSQEILVQSDAGHEISTKESACHCHIVGIAMRFILAN